MRWAPFLALLCLCSLFSSSSQAAPTYVWGHLFEDSGSGLNMSGAIDADHNSYVIGDFFDTLSLGGSPLFSNGSSDVFLASFDEDGNHRWSFRFGDIYQDWGECIAVDSNGDVIVGGMFLGGFDLGGGALINPTSTKWMFLAKFDSSGKHVWSQAFECQSTALIEDIATGPDREILLTGHFFGAIDLGGGLLPSAGDADVFLAKFDRDGNHLFSRRFGDANAQYGKTVAVDAAGAIALAGEARGSIDLGGGPLTSAGLEDVFLARFGSTGTHSWSRIFGDASEDRVHGVAVTSSGEIAIAGGFSISIDLGGSTLVTAGSQDMYVAEYSRFGSHLWSKRIGGTGFDDATDLIWVDGEFWITGSFQGSLSFGGGLIGGGYDSLVLAGYDSAGDHVASRAFPVVGTGLGHTLSANAQRLLMTGKVYDGVDLGGGLLHANFLAGCVGSYTRGDPPEVVAPITDLTMTENDPPLLAYENLNDVFEDPVWGDDLSYSIVGNDNPDLVTVTVGALDLLNVYPQPDQEGVATIAVRATNPDGGQVEDVFTVTVDPMPDEPEILAIEDVRNDQGRQVRLSFLRSNLDELGSATPVLQYEMYRRIDALPKGLSLEGVLQKANGNWEYVGALPAHGELENATVASTLADSTEQGIHWSVFFVRAATANPLVFHDSAPDSGYSVDNLAPNLPQGFVVAYGSANQLSWEPSEDEDFRYFKIYRGATADFVIDPENPLHVTLDTGWMDATGDWDSHYKISAVDFAGNESEAVVPEQRTGLQETPRITRTRLHPNLPNPFNPSTLLRFDLAVGGRVTLKVYDLAGRHVRTLVDETLEAGPQERIWDGRDQSGRSVVSGVYVARLVAQGDEQSVRMVLLK